MSDNRENHDQRYLEDQLGKSVERWIKHHPAPLRAQDVHAGKIFFTIVIGGPMVGAIAYLVISHNLSLPFVLVALVYIGLFFHLFLFD